MGSTKKPRKATARQRAAGASNLLAWRQKTGRPPALRHGATSASARAGKMPVGFEDLQPMIDDFHAGWIADLGGRENLTRAQEALLSVSRGCLAIFALGMEEVKREGILDAEGQPQGVLKIMATYANTLRLNLARTGLERKARNITGTALESALAKIESAESGEGADEGEAEES